MTDGGVEGIPGPAGQRDDHAVPVVDAGEHIRG
jgi:hypothetical protein